MPEIKRDFQFRIFFKVGPDPSLNWDIIMQSQFKSPSSQKLSTETLMINSIVWWENDKLVEKGIIKQGNLKFTFTFDYTIVGI